MTPKHQSKIQIRFFGTIGGRMVDFEDYQPDALWEGLEDIEDWIMECFDGGPAVVRLAEGASHADHADEILTRHYIDKPERKLRWVITEYSPGLMF